MTPEPEAEIGAVVARLTKAQRSIMGGDCRDIGNPPVWYLVWADHSTQRGAKTLAVLNRLGITETTRFGPTSLTPLGLRVRHHLTAQSKEA
jgi:hypothetical protein